MTYSSVPKSALSTQEINAAEFYGISQQLPAISPELQATLQHIVDDVVAGLDCVGAMVATLEGGNALPVRAYAVNFAQEFLKEWEKRLGISVIGPKSVAYLDDRKFKDNLSIRAVKGVDGHPESYVTSDSLYDLFRPVVSKPLSILAQQTTGIKQVIAVPFFLEDEVVGNLFAAARREFSPEDIAFLTALGHQAATAIESQRRLAEIHTLERVILALQASMTDEKQVLQIIVDAVVHELDFVGAMVATLETGNVLPVRAYSISFAQDFIEAWEKRLGVGFLSPSSVAYLDNPEFKDNLSARAVKGVDGRPERYVISDSLYDLFRPVVNRPLSAMAQKFTGIKQVIAVPFFLEDEVVGNLFAATRRPRFSKREIELLTLLGQQAAVGIRNARIYRKSEERRQAAEIFARMAFSSAAYVHALRNHVGAFKMYTQLVKSHVNGSFQELGDQVNERLGQAANILDHLHEPWRESPDALTDVNVCLKRALDKVVPDYQASESKDGVAICLSLAERLPAIKTSPDMLSEAFKVLIKNAVEAVQEKFGQKGQGKVWVESRHLDGQAIEIRVRDNGAGIKPENLSKVFELRWTTKKDVGMGFGLFWTKDFVEGQGGTIEVESTWQEGATFSVRLPLVTG